jgi:LPXTG-motif cell wall-anchored protein
LPSTTYYFRVLATNPGQGTQNGSILSFVTLAAGAPATPSVPPVTPPATIEPAPTAPTVELDMGDEGSEPTILEVTEAGLVLPEPQTIKPGHTFGGWLIGSTVYQPGETVNPVGSVVASAVWARVEQVSETELADTGFASTNWMSLALVLLAIGGSLLVYARRRA